MRDRTTTRLTAFRVDLEMASNVLATEKWRILKNAIMTATKKERTPLLSDAEQNLASVRRFNRFGLLTVSMVPPPDIAYSGQWLQYSYVPRNSTDAALTTASLVKLLRYESVSLEAMIGFNNTGNVCVWPSEEVLAYYCLERRSMFQGAAVCEIGCGMTGLAGLMLACTRTPSYVLLTDGNDTSVENVKENVLANASQFGKTSVSAEVLLWSSTDIEDSHRERFDCVICADCLFFEEMHSKLALVIHTLLKPGSSKALLFAPRRGITLENFCKVAEKYFEVEQIEGYDDTVWRIHQENTTENKLYSSDLHYPLLIVLVPKIQCM